MPDDTRPADRPIVPPGVDVDRANAARIYDHFLGGANNVAVDREHAERIRASNPEIVRIARANRSYLRRVVQWSCRRGIDQFLDLGSGVPTVGNVHEVARALDPTARVAYVDIEPVAVAHAEQILAGVDGVTVTRADLRDPDAVLGAPGIADLLDLDRPVAVLSVAVLHFVPEGLGDLLARYRSVLVAGSVMALSHVISDHPDTEIAARTRASSEAYRGTASPVTPRSRAEVADLLAGLRPVPPGLVDVVDWPAPSGEEGTGMSGLVAVVDTAR